jgi:predicted acyl esterase
MSDLDQVLSKICGELNIFPKSIPHTRNHLRRAVAGFKVMRDIRIPVRDGKYILGDAYLPLEHRKRYPVLIGCTVYGKRVVYAGPDLQDAEDIAAFERAEDEWHSTTADFEIDILNRGS